MRLLILFFALVASVSCTTRVQYEYFEPSGMGQTISSPDGAPSNVAQQTIGAVQVSVWSTVINGRIEVSIAAEVAPGKSVSFNGNSAILVVGSSEEGIPIQWGNRRFDAPLEGNLRAKARYDCVITLPERFSAAREFTLILPAPEGRDGLRLRFARKFADYRTSYQLQ